jgi:cardiolipin synthase
VRLLHTKPGRDEIYQLHKEAALRARRYIYIENAYFIDDALLCSLIVARRRGVDLRVIITLETDRGLISRNIILAANTMLAQRTRVYIYPGFSHTKAAIFDGWASMGSANLDRLSLHINREINIATSEPSALQALTESLSEPDFARSTELTEPLPQHWTDHIIEMFGDCVFWPVSLPRHSRDDDHVSATGPALCDKVSRVSLRLWHHPQIGLDGLPAAREF